MKPPDSHPILRLTIKLLDDGTTLAAYETKNCMNTSTIDGQGPNADEKRLPERGPRIMVY